MAKVILEVIGKESASGVIRKVAGELGAAEKAAASLVSSLNKLNAESASTDNRIEGLSDSVDTLGRDFKATISPSNKLDNSLDRLADSIDSLDSKVDNLNIKKKLTDELKNTSAATKKAAGSASIFDKKIGDVSITSLAAGGALAKIATGAFEFGKASLDAAGQAQRLGNATDGLAKSIGESGDALVESIIATSGKTVDSLTAMEAANKALSFGIIKSKEDMEVLTRTAKVLGPALGQSVGKALDDITIGLGRNSKLILDNVGIVVDAKTANENFAQSIGVSVRALTDEQKAIAFRTEAMIQMTALVDKIGEGELTLADRSERLTATFIDLKIATGELLGVFAGPGLDAAAEAISEIARSTKILTGVTKELIPQIQQLAPTYDELGAAVGQRIFGKELISAESRIALAINEVDILKQQIAVVGNNARQRKFLNQALVEAEARYKELSAAISIASDATDTANARMREDIGLLRQMGAAARITTVDLISTADAQKAFATETARASASLSNFMEAAGVSFETSIIGATSDGAQILGDAFKAFSVPLPEEEDGGVAKAVTKTIDNKINTLKSLSSQVLGEGFGALGDIGVSFKDQEGSVAENAKRLAIIARDGIINESDASIAALKAENPKLIKALLASGDPGAEARSILAQFETGIDTFGLIDREKAKARIKNMFLGGQAQEGLISELASEVAAELGVSVAQVQQSIQGEFGGAAQNVGAGLPSEKLIEQTKEISGGVKEIGVAGVESGAILAESFLSVPPHLLKVSELFDEMINQLGRIDFLATTAGGSIGSIGSELGVEASGGGAESGGGTGGGGFRAGGSFTVPYASMPKFATGGSMTVGPSATGDSAVFRAGAGEKVTVETPQQQAQPIVVNVHIDSELVSTRLSEVMGASATSARRMGGRPQ